MIRWLLAVLFVVAGITKLSDVSAFASTISDFGLVHPVLELPTAVALSVCEIAAGCLLLFDLRGGLALSVALLCAFLAVLAYGIQIGLDIQCGCFGAGRRHDLPTAFRTDLALLLLCCYLYIARRTWSLRTRRWQCERQHS